MLIQHLTCLGCGNSTSSSASGTGKASKTTALYPVTYTTTYYDTQCSCTKTKAVRFVFLFYLKGLTVSGLCVLTVLLQLCRNSGFHRLRNWHERSRHRQLWLVELWLWIRLRLRCWRLGRWFCGHWITHLARFPIQDRRSNLDFHWRRRAERWLSGSWSHGCRCYCGGPVNLSDPGRSHCSNGRQKTSWLGFRIGHGFSLVTSACAVN